VVEFKKEYVNKKVRKIKFLQALEIRKRKSINYILYTSIYYFIIYSEIRTKSSWNMNLVRERVILFF